MGIHSGRARILAQEDGVALSAGDWRMNSKRSIQCTLIHTLLTITKSMSSIPGGEGAKHELPLCTTSPSPSLAGIVTPVQTGRGRPDAGVATRSAALQNWEAAVGNSDDCRRTGAHAYSVSQAASANN